MIVGVLTTCHAQYTWDSSICVFLFNTVTLQVCVTYLTGALLNSVQQKTHKLPSQVYCIWQVVKTPTIISNNPVYFYLIEFNRAPVRYVTKTLSVILLNKKIHILLSQVYCAWQVVKTWQLFWITLYIYIYIYIYMKLTYDFKNFVIKVIL